MWPTAEPDPFDRSEQERLDSEARKEALTEPGRTWFTVAKSAVGPVRHDEPPPAGEEAFFLGRSGGRPWFAFRCDPGDLSPLREAVTRLDPVARSAALTAVALDNWHHTHPHCPRCGGATIIERGGWMRRCPEDGSEHFPRVDPAVIVLVVDEDGRALLGRRAVWPEGWFSTLAGFVEPGETFEQAVVREVAEEAGVVVSPDTVHYRSSQPWPFPASVMVAFRAVSARSEAAPDGEEIAEARWFTRDEFARACGSGSVLVPPEASVAHQLIKEWFGRSIPHTWLR